MWWNKKFTDWISICVEDPLKTWRKAKKFFRKPQWEINFFSNSIYNCPFTDVNYTAKILDIEFRDVGWKDKYDSPRHETDPYIWICFFKKFGLSISWHVYYRDEFNDRKDGSCFYWEYLLDYLYYNKTLKAYSVWTSDSKIYPLLVNYGDKEDTYEPAKNVIPVVAMSLNKEGVKELKKLI